LNTGAAAVVVDVRLLKPKGFADRTADDAAAAAVVVDDELSPLMLILVAICGIAAGFA
jgi:hypothetical protein